MQKRNGDFILIIIYVQLYIKNLFLLSELRTNVTALLKTQNSKSYKTLKRLSLTKQLKYSQAVMIFKVSTEVYLKYPSTFARSSPGPRVGTVQKPIFHHIPA